MAGARSMLARVRRLEDRRAPALSPFERAYGSFGAWERECTIAINDGTLDRHDMPHVLEAVRQWHSARAWNWV